MALGYEGYVRLKFGSSADIVMGTGASVPDARQRLDSSAGYGGQIRLPADEMGIGGPRAYDWVLWDGSIDFEVTEGLLSRQVVPWIFDRQSSAEVTLQSREGNLQQFSTGFWREITLQASEGQSTTGSIGFWSEDRDSYTIGGDYIGNKTGEGFLCGSTGPTATYVPEQLNPDGMNEFPVPFWDTQIVIDGLLVEFVDWSLGFSQDVVTFFGCEHTVGPQGPKYVAVGPMTATFTGDYMFVGTAAWSVPDALSTLNVVVGGETIKTATLERTTDTDAVVSGGSLVPIGVEYHILELVP